MSTKYTDVEVFIADFDFPLIIDFDFSPGSPGSWYKKNGDPGSAPDPPDIEIIAVSLVKGGTDIITLLGDETLTAIEEGAMNYAVGDMGDQP